ncbi:MAG TPA: OsmC family protein [Steroidobacteraceae bacterium]|nr:OsmC family protein [Steroidobacteraceae bacterium]
MHPFPHHYSVAVTVRPGTAAKLRTAELAAIESAPPKAFGGSGERWSPEELFAAAVADCIVLNFQGIAANSKFAWTGLDATTNAVLDRVEGKMRFTRFDTHVSLVIPAGADPARARLLLEKAEASCPLSNTLNCEKHLTMEINQS